MDSLAGSPIFGVEILQVFRGDKIDKLAWNPINKPPSIYRRSFGKCGAHKSTFGWESVSPGWFQLRVRHGDLGDQHHAVKKHGICPRYTAGRSRVECEDIGDILKFWLVILWGQKCYEIFRYSEISYNIRLSDSSDHTVIDLTRRVLINLSRPGSTSSGTCQRRHGEISCTQAMEKGLADLSHIDTYRSVSIKIDDILKYTNLQILQMLPDNCDIDIV